MNARTRGDVLTDLMQERLMQGGSRMHDGGEPRKITWDDNTRAVVASIANEIFLQSQEQMSKHFGVDASTHAEHHQGLGELIPWIRAQKNKTEKQAEFWQALVQKNAERAISWALWGLAAAVFFGLTPAIEWIGKLIKP